MRKYLSRACATSVALLIAMFVATSVCLAANHYVRAGAAGNGSGSDWTNACSNFAGSCAPVSLTRGDTYYVAAGTYLSGGANWNAPTSGSLVITVKRATVADHGSDTGWTAAMDGQVTFGAGGWMISTSNWIFEGQTGNAIPTATAVPYGFTISDNATSGTGLVETSGSTSNITLNHFRISGVQCCGANYNGVYGFFAPGGSNLNFNYVELDQIKSDPFHFNGVTGVTVDHAFVTTNLGGISNNHGQGFWMDEDTNVTIRNSFFQDIAGTAYIVCGSGASGVLACNNINVYGNVFYHSRTHPQVGPSDADGETGYLIECIFSTSSNSNPCHGFNFTNNVISNFDDNNPGLYPDSLNTGFVWLNNIWYNIDCSHGGGGTCFIPMPSGAVGSHDYNTFLSISSLLVSTDPLSSHEFLSEATVTPFVASSGRNYHLVSDTSPAHLNDGLALASPFSVDPDGNTRGTNGAWDRGAYQFSSGTATAPQPPSQPSPPQNLRGIVQ